MLHLASACRSILTTSLHGEQLCVNNLLFVNMGPIAKIDSSRVDIVKSYKKATYSYLTPLAFLLLGFLWDSLLILSLFTVLPCSIIGLYFTRTGFKLASKQGDLEKKDVGYANMWLGVILFGLGLLGAGFAFITTS